MREISPLQKERLNYQPKLAGALANGINSVKLSLGDTTTSVADMEDIKNLFPNVYGKPIAKFAAVGEDLSTEKKNVGVILSTLSSNFSIGLVIIYITSLIFKIKLNDKNLKACSTKKTR